MKSLHRVLLSLLILLALLLMGACSGNYGCRVTFGNSTCDGGGGGGFGGGGGGGGGGGSDGTAAFAYAVDEAGTVDGYALNTKANTFSALSVAPPTIPASETGVGMAVVKDKFIYTLFQPDNLIYGYTFDTSSGALSTISGFPMALPLSVPAVGFNQYNITSDPLGQFLFIADTFADQVYVFTVGTSGQLVAVAGSPFTTPLEPGNLTTDGLGKYLYICEDTSFHTGLGVMAYAIGSDGTLTPVQGSPFAFHMWQMQPDSSGVYLYGTTGNTLSVTGADDNHIYLFSITQSGTTAGALVQVGTGFATTYSPFTIAAEPGTENVYSFSFNDTATGYNPVEGYNWSSSSGTLNAISGSPFSNIATGHWGQFTPDGSFLFVYSSVSSGSGTTTQLGPLTVDTNGGLTQPVSSATLATPGYWVITD